nr:protein JASON-like [Tanacetum cinerariifolium]
MNEDVRNRSKKLENVPKRKKRPKEVENGRKALMGCFSIFPCFTKTRKTNSYYYVADQGNGKIFEPPLIKFPTQESTNLDSIHTPILISSDDGEDQLINSSDRRKVSTYLDVNDSIDDVESVDDKEDSGKLGILVQLESEKERENENGNLGFLVHVENEKERKKDECGDDGGRVEIEKENESKSESDGEKEVKTDENKNVVQSQAVSDSSVSSFISYPPMHRYHNCVINEEEEDDDDDEVLEQEETSESLFSVSINQRRLSMSFLVEVDDDKEVNSPLKVSTSPEVITKTIDLCSNESDVNQRVDSLLNPIENLAQWRTLKARPLPTLDHRQEKENVDLEQDMPIPLSEEPRSKVAERKRNPKTNTAVTTSLSSWLVEPEKTTANKEESQYSTGNSYTYSDGATSWKSIEDRPILGAWTIDEVKHISARSSPRKSPSRSNPDETPIIFKLVHIAHGNVCKVQKEPRA